MRVLQLARFGALATGLALTLSCVRFRYERDLIDSPPNPAAVELLVEGLSLERCLDLLGAPTRVEALDQHLESTVLSTRLFWAWHRHAGWAFSASAQIDNAPAVSLEFERASRRLPALVLEFDGDLRLAKFERAYLAPAAPTLLEQLSD